MTVAARILIIEDNPANIELMTYLLEAYGYPTETAMDGAEGLRAAERYRPDVILCDIQLPVMDGYEVARRLQDSAELSHIPLIAVTAFAMVDDRERILAMGFDGCLTKPIEPETFVQQVEGFIRPALRTGGRSAQSATSARDPTPASETMAVARPSGQTILVVDDLDVHLELAAGLLGPSGYRVVTANGVTAALSEAQRSRPDLILSDVSMNDGSGFDLIRAAKADPALRHIPIVFVTSTNLQSRDRMLALSLGAARYLVRPLEPQQLLKEIESCLSEQPTR